MVAAAIIIGCGLSVWGSVYGVKLELNNFTKSMFYYLFMYGVGLAVGPSFVNSLGGDGIRFSFLALVSCVIGLALVVLGAMLFGLPLVRQAACSLDRRQCRRPSARQRRPSLSGVLNLPPGMTTPDQVSSMIALSYGITYIWGTVGIILITKYLPRWWGVDASAAARQYEVGAWRRERRHTGPEWLDLGALRSYGCKIPNGRANPSVSFLLKSPNTRS